MLIIHSSYRSHTKTTNTALVCSRANTQSNGEEENTMTTLAGWIQASQKYEAYGKKSTQLLRQIQEVYLGAAAPPTALPPVLQTDARSQPTHLPQHDDFFPQRWTVTIDCRSFGLPVDIEEAVVRVCAYQRERLSRANAMRRGVRNDPINLVLEEMKMWLCSELPAHTLCMQSMHEVRVRLVYMRRLRDLPNLGRHWRVVCVRALCVFHSLRQTTMTDSYLLTVTSLSDYYCCAFQWVRKAISLISIVPQTLYRIFYVCIAARAV
jgi:hypothetical protein